MIVTPYATFKGYGGYRGAGSRYPSHYGARLGALLGEGVERGAGMIPRLLGFGAYEIKRNTLLGMGTDPPSINNSQSDKVIFRHREFIGDVRTGTIPAGQTVTEFKIDSFNINPANTRLFPLGSNIAANFQEYEMRGMIVEIKTLSSEFALSSILGSMFVGTQYNAGSPAPETKQELENLQFSTSSKPSESLIHGIECARALNVDTHLYVAVDNNYNGGDPRFFDLGTIYVGTQGNPLANAPIGELWVSYEVALIKPRLQAPITKSLYYASSNLSSGNLFSSAGLGNAHANISPSSYQGIDIVQTQTSFIDINFPKISQSWKVNMYWRFSASIVPETFTFELPAGANAGMTLKEVYSNHMDTTFQSGTFYGANEDSFASDEFCLGFIVDINQQNATDQFNIARITMIDLNPFPANPVNCCYIDITSWNTKVTKTV